MLATSADAGVPPKVAAAEKPDAAPRTTLPPDAAIKVAAAKPDAAVKVAAVKRYVAPVKPPRRVTRKATRVRPKTKKSSTAAMIGPGRQPT